MSSNENQRQLYVKEIGKWIPVSLDFYREYYREINAFCRRQKYRGRCCCPRRKRWTCNAVCYDCKFSIARGLLSLDAEIDAEIEADGTVSVITRAETIADPTENVEEKIIQIESYAALYQEMEHLASDDRRVCELIMEGETKRESARILGCPWTTYRRRYEKTMTGLRSKFEDETERC